MSWHFSQALVAEYSLGNCSETEPYVPSNGMNMPQAFSSGAKTTGFYGHSRFGLTCGHLTESRGEELLMSYLAGFHARTSAAQESAKVSPESVPGYGQSSLGWFAKWSRSRCEWRTPQISFLEDSELYSETWPRSGSMRNGVCYLRPILAPIISASDFGSSLPTLTVSGNHNRPYPGKKSGYGLATALAMLPTLTTIGMNGGSNSRRATAKRGEEPTHIGPLNPDWCEWFMGFPIGWTVSGALEMPRYLEWLQQHSPCSKVEEIAA